MRKGQAAMEFLMTYGWAILVLLAAVAALSYFGVLNPTRFLPETCTFPSGFSCLGHAAISDANNMFDFAIVNNNGYKLNITGISDDPGANDDCANPTIQGCLGIGCAPAGIPSGIVMSSDDQAIIRINCTSISSGRFSADVVLTYLSFESGISFKTTGQIRGNAN